METALLMASLTWACWSGPVFMLKVVNSYVAFETTIVNDSSFIFPKTFQPSNPNGLFQLVLEGYDVWFDQIQDFIGKNKFTGKF